MATSLTSLLNPLLQYASGSLMGTPFVGTQSTSPSGSFGLPQLAGLGLLATSAARQDDPMYNSGARDQAFQYLRNQFTSPLGSQIGDQIGSLQGSFQPFFDQQDQKLLNNVQQRYIAGAPTSLSTAMSGPEILGLRNAVTQDILPQRQAFYGNLALDLQNRQTNAAKDLLNFTQPNPLDALLPYLGYDLLTRQSPFGGSGGGLLGQLTGTGGQGSVFNGLPGSGQQGGGGLGGLPSNYGMPTQLGQLSAADIMRQMQAGTLSTQEGLSLLARTSLLPAIGAGLAGYGVGNQLGPAVGSNQFQSSGVGALSGAATGAMIGSVIPGLGTAVGAIIGGLAGGAGGLFGEQSQQQQQKAYNLSQDLDSQKDQVLELGNVAMQMGQTLGIPASALQAIQAQAQQLAATSSSPADEQGMIAQAIGAMFRQYVPPEQWTQVAPMLKAQYLNYMTNSTFTAPNSSYSGGAPSNLINQWGSMIGLARGGVTTRPTMAMVGERGAELAFLPPGAMVLPLQSNAATQRQSPQNRAAGIMPLGQQLSGQIRSAENFAPRMVPSLLRSMNVPAHAYGAGGNRLSPGTTPAPLGNRLQALLGQGSRVPSLLSQLGLAMPTQAVTPPANEPLGVRPVQPLDLNLARRRRNPFGGTV